LVLYDPGLAGVDPRDPMLTLDMKRRILLECTRNFWYFIREVVRVPQEGGSAGSGSRYKLDRGNLAFFFLSVLNYNIYYTAPRQFGKTTALCVRYLWCYNFGTSNTEMMLMHKAHDGSKSNLADIVSLRDTLPSYLQLSSNVGIDGKRLKVPNTKVTIANPFNGNKIITYPSARSKDAADKLGRGATIALQSWDEFAFIPYNRIAYAAAIPAQSKAAENAKIHGAPNGIIITTTPGDLTTEEGKYAYEMRNNATRWTEQFLDFTMEQLEEVRQANTNSAFFLIEYNHVQLGASETYLRDIVVKMNKDWPKIRREVLLEWADISDNCPFTKEDLERVKEFCRPPIRTLLYGRFNQYQVQVYEDIDLRYPPIIGVDVSGAMYRDASAITIVDSRTTKVCATLNCNYIPTDDLADVVYNIVKYKMPNAVINIERNGEANFYVHLIFKSK